MEIDISIVVVTYNQKNTVLQTLESIKYQLEHYHNNETIQLIIADDASKDGTQEYIDKWLERNRTIFTEVNRLFSNVNQGTCKNAGGAYRLIKGTHIISMAGDDMLMNTNVLKRIGEVQAEEIVACPPLKFKDGYLVTDQSKYYNDMIAVFFDKKDIIKRSKFSCPITNGAMLGKRFFDKEAYTFSEQFVLLDDWSRFVKIFEEINNFKYSYSDEPILLYRLSDLQVTNQHSSAHQILNNDVKELSEYLLKRIKNPFTRIRVQMQRLHVVNPKLYSILKFLNLGACWDFFLYYIVHKKKIRVMVNRMIQYGKENSIDAYLYEIDKSARHYLEEEY